MACARRRRVVCARRRRARGVESGAESWRLECGRCGMIACVVGARGVHMVGHAGSKKHELHASRATDFVSDPSEILKYDGIQNRED
eukprot:1097276-Rhodomonas_salina.1